MGYQKLVRSGNLIEIYDYSKDLPERREGKREVGPKRSVSASRRIDNAKRLKKSFIRLVRANLDGNGRPVFLTLTMAEVARIDDAYGIFTEFGQRFRRRYGSHIRYIAVPEFQERGAVHFHVLVWGLSEEVIYAETPKSVSIEGLVSVERGSRQLQHLWGYGYVDCLLTDGSPKLAFYVAKYMHKALLDERLRGQKSYSCSRNCLRPLSLATKTSVAFALDAWGVKLSTAVPLLEKNFDTYWLGRGRYRSYLIN